MDIYYTIIIHTIDVSIEMHALSALHRPVSNVQVKWNLIKNI